MPTGEKAAAEPARRLHTITDRQSMGIVPDRLPAPDNYDTKKTALPRREEGPDDNHVAPVTNYLQKRFPRIVTATKH